MYGVRFFPKSSCWEPYVKSCRGCLGGYVRAPPAAATAAAALREKANRTFKKRRPSAHSSSRDQCWVSSSYQMEDNGKFHSRSVHEGGSASDHNNAQEPSFENHALKHWYKQRQEWVGRQKPGPQRGLREPVIKWSSTYEDLLGTSRPFTQPVPLPEMVDFLVDVWEQEGLYG